MKYCKVHIYRYNCKGLIIYPLLCFVLHLLLPKHTQCVSLQLCLLIHLHWTILITGEGRKRREESVEHLPYPFP
jgi:hypothetical protein